MIEKKLGRSLHMFLTLAVLGELLIDLLHSLHVVTTRHNVVDHRQRVILPDDALSGLLDRFRRHPRLVDVFGREVLERRDVLADVIAIGVGLTSKLHRAVAVEELLEERRAAEPQPHPGVDAPIGIEQQLLEHLHALLPADPQVPAREKASDGMSR